MISEEIVHKVIYDNSDHLSCANLFAGQCDITDIIFIIVSVGSSVWLQHHKSIGLSLDKTMISAAPTLLLQLI